MHSFVPRLAALCLLGVFAACVSSEDTAPPPRIVLERADSADRWRATYELAAETGLLRFERPAAFYRESVWEVVTPGWTLARDGDAQVLVAEEGVETSRIVMEFPVHTDNLQKEYEFFQSFTDGSVAIYTGHLFVAPAGGEAPEEELDYLRRLELVPQAGERLVVLGKVAQGRTLWENPYDDGTYVYFGGIAPLETKDTIAIIDPGAPAWMVERLDRLVPEMFALYTERFGEPLPWKPVVLFNFEDVEHSGLASGGGTVTGLVQMSATGKAWHDASPDKSEQLLYLIAHEAAHFWNGQIHTYEEMADSWMNEGSADAFAELALLRSGYIDADRLAQRRTEALNRCASGLRDGPLTEALERRQFRTYYSCGQLIALWSVGIVAEPSDPDALFEIWRVLFEHSDPEDGSYNRDTYLDALSSLGAEPENLVALVSFLDSEQADPAASLVEFMARAGVEIDLLERPVPELRRDRANHALQHLMADSCGGRYSIYTEGPRLRTAAMDECEPFSVELRVLSIEGHGNEPDGDLALDAVTARCSRGEPVTLGLEDGSEARVPCASPPPPLPAPLSFPRL